MRGRWRGPLFTRISRGDRVVRHGISGETVNDILKRGLEDAHHSAEVHPAGPCLPRGSAEGCAVGSFLSPQLSLFSCCGIDSRCAMIFLP